MKSLLEKYKEEFSMSDDRFCGYCLIVESSNGCDCDQHAWRTFDELDDESQLRLINQEFDLTKEMQ